MKIDIVAVGSKMPGWVTDGWETYAKRFPPDWRIKLIEIPASKRLNSASVDRALQEEGNRILDKTRSSQRRIALDRLGKPQTSLSLAKHLDRWQMIGEHTSLIIGGPEGLSQHCLDQCHETWSLSTLTLPHPLVRVMVIEQLFRGWSINAKHPYHR